VKNSIVQIVALVLGVVFSAALQDMLPVFGGVKPPLVMAVVVYVAFRSSLAYALGTGFAVGVLLDSLSGVNAFCAVVSMPLAALGVYFLRDSLEEVPGFVSGALTVAAAAVFGEVWLAVSGAAAGDAGLLVRILAAAMFSLPLGAAMFALLPQVARHVGLEEESR